MVYWSIDIDECINGDHGCNQKCTNTNGSYICICEDGYVLDNDMKTCIGMCIIRYSIHNKHNYYWVHT